MSKLAWKEIDWTLVQKRLSRQQRRVYKASIKGNCQTVHALQRRIIRSLDAKLLAVKLVTTKNTGHNIIRAERAKELSHRKKIELTYGLKLNEKSKYIQNVYSTRVGTKKKELKSLDIAIIEDAAKQMLAKLALEPEWEAIFEPNSYGFRLGRSYRDAITSLTLSLREENRFVLDPHIHKYFEEINHNKLVTKLNTFDQMKSQIKAWLKVDIMVGLENESDEVNKILNGTLQKKIISPLLANIALHGLENHIKNWYINSCYSISDCGNFKEKRDKRKVIGFSRYLNNFIITAPNYADILEIEKVVDKWLIKEVGLTLSKSKTNIVDSTSGFKFLGFQIISIKIAQNEEYKVKIRPSKESKLQIIKCTNKIIQTNKSSSSYMLIAQLTYKIINWANYFCFGKCKKDFSEIDYIIFKQIRAWVFRRKSKGLQSRKELKEKYFPNGNIYTFRANQYQNNWILTGSIKDKEGNIKQNFLPKMSWIGANYPIRVNNNVILYTNHHSYRIKRKKTSKCSYFSNKVNKLIKI